MDNVVKSYITQKEETDYWHGEAKRYEKSYDTLLGELNEYQTSSHELEAELEAQLNQSETKLRDLKVFCSKLQFELEDTKERYEKLHHSSILQILDLEDKLKTLENYKETSKKYIRQLEQTNDDLERANRASMASLEDYEYKLTQAIEHNVFLETDIEEKEAAYFADVQHLKEEIRDLKHEMEITHKKKQSVFTKELPRLSEESKSFCPSKIQQKRKSSQGILGLRKHSAMTIISEIMEQIRVMEKKVAFLNTEHDGRNSISFDIPKALNVEPKANT